MSTWISVGDRLPEGITNVLVTCKSDDDDTEPFVLMVCYNNGEFDDEVMNYRVTRYVTHWMPLPEPAV